MIHCLLNDTPLAIEVPPGTLLLDFLRRNRHLMATKEGCREGDCGACTVLIGELQTEGFRYHTATSCLTAMGSVHGKHVVTLEGLLQPDPTMIQQAIVAEGATQCGFCTPGIIIALTGFLLNVPSWTADEARRAIEGSICRCTGYTSIDRAVRRLCDQLEHIDATSSERLDVLIGHGLIPGYFRDVAKRLEQVPPLEARSPCDRAPLLVAGGTDLFVQRPDQLGEVSICLLSRRPGTPAVRINEKDLVIDAAATVEELRRDPILQQHLPSWQSMFDLVSSTPVRNLATVGGNLVNASPIGDLSIALLAHETVLEISGGNRLRSVPLDRFYRGYKQMDLAEGEWVETLRLPLPLPGLHVHFEKVSRRKYLDIASVNSALSLHTDGKTITRARLSAGGVAPVPKYLADCSAWLSGQPLSAQTVYKLLPRVAEEINPIGDVRGSADYKKRLLKRLVFAHFVCCFPELALEEVPT